MQFLLSCAEMVGVIVPIGSGGELLGNESLGRAPTKLIYFEHLQYASYSAWSYLVLKTPRQGRNHLQEETKAWSCYVTFFKVKWLVRNGKDRTPIDTCQARAPVLSRLPARETWGVCTESKSRHFCCSCRSGFFLALEGAVRFLHPKPVKVPKNVCSGESRLPRQR